VFTTLLIANRGEIACRIAATARRLGIKTVAVHSDADARARHVAACDMAVRIGTAEPQSSYLLAERILEAARQTGAQAIHPGYGFLSENAAFAQACADASIVFVGPPPSAIAAMGSKSAAKALMEKAAVPLVPGYHGDNQDPMFLLGQADSIGYPVLIKASAGGGGKGMRIVESSADFLDALASCKREARSSFGSDEVLIERYLQKPRHIEIQVFADSHGNAVHLFERDCSVQRRHQKVIEEAPAPGMTPERRRAMGEAAIAAARAVGYVGAGTVEFIAEPDGRFYFMEMNTRLQVEHPVTEMITGLDLVQWQLQVAAGHDLPATQDQLTITGHAIEARIYAENPDNDFLPSIGTLATLNFPSHAAFENGDVRIDGGVRAGDTITPYYDPMIAKLIVRGEDREQARARMMQALGGIQAVGVQTNVDFLQRLMRDEAFAAADLDTGLIARRHDSLFPEHADTPLPARAAAVAADLARQGVTHPGTPQAAPVAQDPWQHNDAWRVGGVYRRRYALRAGKHEYALTLQRRQGQWLLGDADAPLPFSWRATPAPQSGQYELHVVLGDAQARATAVLHQQAVHLFMDGQTHVLNIVDALADAAGDSEIHQGGMTAPMPGKIIAIAVAVGDTVRKGDALLVMEAMKMEHTIYAPADGSVSELFYQVGDQVAEGLELIAIDAAG